MNLVTEETGLINTDPLKTLFITSAGPWDVIPHGGANPTQGYSSDCETKFTFSLDAESHSNEGINDKQHNEDVAARI